MCRDIVAICYAKNVVIVCQGLANPGPMLQSVVLQCSDLVGALKFTL